MSISFEPSLSALSAVDTAMNATAHNIANVNTDNYVPTQTVFREGLVYPDDSVTISSVQADVYLPVQLEPYAGPSQTDVAREMVNLSTYENIYTANAKVVQAYNDVLGYYVDSMI